MKTWVKYGAAIMGLLIVSALIISFGMKKEESYRDIKVMSIKGTATVERASVGALDAYEDMGPVVCGFQFQFNSEHG